MHFHFNGTARKKIPGTSNHEPFGEVTLRAASPENVQLSSASEEKSQHKEDNKGRLQTFVRLSFYEAFVLLHAQKTYFPFIFLLSINTTAEIMHINSQVLIIEGWEEEKAWV